MAETYQLELTIGEVATSSPFPTHEEAISATVDAFIANFPDEDEIFSLPEPVTEDDLRAFISGLALDREFAFEII